MKNISYIVLCCVFCFSCEYSVSTGGESSSYSINSESGMDEQLLQEIIKKDEATVEVLLKKDFSLLKEMASENFLSAETEDADELFEAYDLMFSTNDFQRFDTYHIVADEPLMSIEFQSGFAGKGDTSNFDLKIKSLSEENVFSMLVHNEGDAEVMHANLWSLYDGEFQLDLLSASILSIHGLTAPEFYHESRKMEEEGDYINAFLFASYADICKNPIPNVMYYHSQDDITEQIQLQHKIINEKIEFPIVIEQMESKPEVMSLGLYRTEKLTYSPLVQYYSTIDVSDEELISKERREIYDYLDDIFPQIFRFHSEIMIGAYNREENTSMHD